jgi:thiamine-monophosphate kinase
VAPLVRDGGAAAMIDVSDGLASELHHLAAASGVGFRIDAAKIPVGRGARAWASLAGGDPLAPALGGGEDYALLCTLPAAAAGAVIDGVRAAADGIAVADIGEAVPAVDGIALRTAGGELPLERRGYEHFAAAATGRRPWK